MTVRFSVVRAAAGQDARGPRAVRAAPRARSDLAPARTCATAMACSGLPPPTSSPRDPVRAAARWARFMGGLPRREGKLVALPTDRGKVLIGTRAQLRALLGAAPRSPGIAGYALACKDPKAFARTLRAGRPESEPEPRRRAAASARRRLAPRSLGEVMTQDLCSLSATELLAAYRAKTLSPVEATRAVLARIAELNPVLNCFNLIDAKSALEAARASEARWSKGAPIGPARRRAGLDQGPHPHQGLADAARLEDHRSRGPLERRCARGRAPARARRGAPRQDHHARVRLEGRHRQPAHRHHAQSLEPEEDARRLLGRRRGGGRLGHGPAHRRHRRRRLDPHSLRASPGSSA